MDQFVSTTRKDYLWPYVRTFGKKLIEPPVLGTGFDKKCMCHCYPPPAVPLGHQVHASPEGHFPEEDWSRNGPMGPLLDPKIYPVQVGKPPETNTMREDQPNTFLKKLHEKYPFLYEVLQTKPSADLNDKVNKDRLKSTYQVDYCKMTEYPPDDMLRAEGVLGEGPDEETVREPGLPYRQNKKPAMSFSAMAGKGFGFVGEAAKKAKELRGGEGSSGGGGVSVWTPIKSEYQDAICKIGDIIMREKLHYHNKKR